MKTVAVVGSHTGHTILAACLDCHPDVMMANSYGRKLTVPEILMASANEDRWVGERYNFSHAGQIRKNVPKLVGNTGGVIDPDYVLLTVRDPYVMANSLARSKRFDTHEKILERLMLIYSEYAEGFLIFYEDFIKSPVRELKEIALFLDLDGSWEEAAEMVKPYEQPRMDIDLSELFDRYAFLGRYA